MGEIGYKGDEKERVESQPVGLKRITFSNTVSISGRRQRYI